MFGVIQQSTSIDTTPLFLVSRTEFIRVFGSSSDAVFPPPILPIFVFPDKTFVFVLLYFILKWIDSFSGSKILFKHWQSFKRSRSKIFIQESVVSVVKKVLYRKYTKAFR